MFLSIISIKSQRSHQNALYQAARRIKDKNFSVITLWGSRDRRDTRWCIQDVQLNLIRQALRFRFRNSIPFHISVFSHALALMAARCGFAIKLDIWIHLLIYPILTILWFISHCIFIIGPILMELVSEGFHSLSKPMDSLVYHTSFYMNTALT